MKELIEVFRMEELSPQTRIKILKELGRLMNFQYAANITEPVIRELIYLLEQKIKPQSNFKDDLEELKEAALGITSEYGTAGNDQKSNLWNVINKIENKLI